MIYDIDVINNNKVKKKKKRSDNLFATIHTFIYIPGNPRKIIKNFKKISYNL